LVDAPKRAARRFQEKLNAPKRAAEFSPLYDGALAPLPLADLRKSVLTDETIRSNSSAACRPL